MHTGLRLSKQKGDEAGAVQFQYSVIMHCHYACRNGEHPLGDKLIVLYSLSCLPATKLCLKTPFMDSNSWLRATLDSSGIVISLFSVRDKFAALPGANSMFGPPIGCQAYFDSHSGTCTPEQSMCTSGLRTHIVFPSLAGCFPTHVSPSLTLFWSLKGNDFSR